MPCMLGDVVGRIIGEGDGCSWQEIDNEQVPSIVKISTPHGTVISSGRFHINEITIEGLKKLLELENDASKSGEIYNGKLPNIQVPINPDTINLPNVQSSAEYVLDINNKHISDIEITEKTNGFSGNMDTKYGYEVGWKHARDYYEKNIVHPKNKMFIDDYKSFKVQKDEHHISKENAEFIWSFMPFWIKHQPNGLNPSFHATESIEGDKEISDKVKKILFNTTGDV